MKKRYILPTIILSLLTVVLLVSCNFGGEATVVTVSYNTDGGNEIASNEVAVGEKLKFPIIPKKEGFIFDGWYSDVELTTPCGDRFFPTENVTIYVKWLEDVTEQLNYVENADGYSVVSIKPEKKSTLSELLIPRKYDGKYITEIADNAFSDNSVLKIVRFEAEIERIGVEAFKNCVQLTSFEMPDSVVDVGKDAFSGCGSLSFEESGNLRYLGNWVIAPKSVTLVVASMKSTTVGVVEGAFKNCSSLTSIDIPASVIKINDEAFSGCSKLSKVTFGENSKLAYLGRAVFKNCAALTDVTIKNDTVINIPSKVTAIKDESFYGCLQLKALAMPEGLSEIGNGAFFDCRKLTSVVIPKNVISIGSQAFYNNIALSSLTFALGGKLNSVGDRAFEKCYSLTELSLPVGTKKVGSGILADCGNLISANIPGSVTEIGENLLFGCTALTEVDLPFIGDGTSIYSFFGYVFGGSSYVDNPVVVPATLKKVSIEKGNVSNYAFLNCSELTEIYLPSALTQIGSWAFGGCEKLVTVGLSEVIASIGSYAFSDCKKLSSVDCFDSLGKVGKGGFYVLSRQSSLNKIDEGVFNNCMSLESVTVPSSASEIGYKAFFGCKALKTPTINVGVTKIGSYAFSGCSAIIDVSVPQGVTEIGSYAFENCSSMVSLTLAQTVVKLGIGVINGCSSLEFESYGNVLYVGNWAFSTVDKQITAVTLKTTTVGIFDYAFEGCRLLEDIVFETALRYIGKCAFKNCSSLRGNLILPANLEKIGAEAFTGTGYSAFTIDNDNAYYKTINGVLFDKQIKTLMAYPSHKLGETYAIPSSVLTVEKTAFYSAENLASVTVPLNVTYLGEDVFKKCFGLDVYCNKNSNSSDWADNFFGDAYVFTEDNSIASLGGFIYFIENSNVYGIKDNTVSFIEYRQTGASQFIVPDSVVVNGSSKAVTRIEGGAFTDSGLTKLALGTQIMDIASPIFASEIYLNNEILAAGADGEAFCGLLAERNVIYIAEAITEISSYVLDNYTVAAETIVFNEVTYKVYNKN